MPHSSSAASGALSSRQFGIPSASTTENVEEKASVVQVVAEIELAAQTSVESVAELARLAEPVAAEQAEQTEEVAKIEVTHRGYRNT